MAKPALGRGLGALLGSNSAAPKPAAPGSAPAAAPAASTEGVRRVPVDQVHPCPFQPRKQFSDESLRELADSIREQGIIQPLVVRPRDGRFELIAGERRWRAAQLLKLKEVPILVREADDRAVLELALIENLQRENLNPIEEAVGYSELIGKFNLTQEEAAVKVGKSRTVVTNALRLLKLPEIVQEHLRANRLSVGHAKVLAGLSEARKQTETADRIVKYGWSVRQTEETLAREAEAKLQPAKKAEAPRDLHVTDLESRIQERIGTKVHLRYKQGKGSVEIRFFSDDDLDRVLGILGVRND